MSVVARFINNLTKWTLVPPSQPTFARGQFDEFGRWESRVQRYDLFWAYYANNAYSSAHLWSNQFKTLFALYKYTRGVYNPLFRLGEFWSTVIWPGALDHRKLQGRVIQSACPVLVDDDAIREAVGRLWRDSNWQENKEMFARLGCVMGDVGLKIDDDPAARRVRLCPTHAGTVRWIRMGDDREVTAYELWEYRLDPRFDPRTESALTPGIGDRVVLYSEKAYKTDTGCRFETYLDNRPYAWNGVAETWETPYRRLPFFLHSHVRVLPNYYWGWSEYQAALTKAAEADDLGSKHHDQIRRASDPKWFLAGVQRPKNELTVKGADPSEASPQPGRQELPFLYGAMGSTAVPLVFPLDNQFVSVETKNQVESLEADYPELRYDAARVAGDASAKALREVRKKAEAKVHSRRSGYDQVLVQAQKVALAIASEAGYPGYEGLGGWAAYEAGELDHQIGTRTVFQLDPLDRAEDENALYTAWDLATRAGVPAEVVMRRLDWSDEEIQAFHDAKQAETDHAMEQQKALIAAKGPPGGTGAPGGPGGSPPAAK